MTEQTGAKLTLLAIDDDPQSLELVSESLDQPDLKIHTTTDPEAGLDLVARLRPQVVLVDLLMPKMNGMELLEKIAEIAPEADVLLFTGHYSTDSAVEAIRKGASDYLVKPLAVATLRERVGKFLDEARRRMKAQHLDGEILEAHRFENMVGRSPMMLQVFRLIRRVAPHFQTVLITGETGTGKELAARALHNLSPASGGRFVPCNCSAIVETLFESELFGHVRGSFSGAVQDKAGFLEYATGGTLFMDEIGDMPLPAQSKLLRVLELREYQRVGSPAMRKADVHIVAATNRSVHDMIEKGQFREDLYYRLSMVEIRLPRLAERKEDLPILERYFIDRFASQYGKTVRGLTPRAEIALARYRWPGNVRELENVLGHACMLADKELIDIQDLPEVFRTGIAPDDDAEGEELLSLDEVYRRHVQRVLDRVGGNKARAAKILGINRATLYRFLRAESAEEEDGGAE